MSKISELFGLYCQNSDLDFKTALETQGCPFTGKICTKMRKSNPDVKMN